MVIPEVIIGENGIRRVNENELAECVAAREGGETELNIAEIKEVIRHTLDILGEVAEADFIAVMGTIDRRQFCQKDST